jgi:hypothetical protein
LLKPFYAAVNVFRKGCLAFYAVVIVVVNSLAVIIFLLFFAVLAVNDVMCSYKIDLNAKYSEYFFVKP